MPITTSTNPNRAVILAAGLGSRLRPLTDDRPKPLVPIRGVPILHNALANLAEIGVGEATIVVGYRKEAIKRSCGCRFSGIDITYVESSVFDRTGSAYSLWLARDALSRGDALLLEGDVFFGPETLPRLLADHRPDVAAVAPFEESMTGSAVTLTPQGRIATFRMNQTAADLANAPPLFKTLNLFRFSRTTLRSTLIPALDSLARGGSTTAYVEQVLASLVNEGKMVLGAAACGDLRWFEIDSEADLRIAEAIFNPSVRMPA